MRAAPTLEAKQKPDDPDEPLDGGGDVDLEDEEDVGKKRPRIRCPLCMWVPRPGDRWGCYCGHSWNTFDTGGRCPECGFQYHHTMCLACHQWSKHVAWYADEPEQ